MASYKQTLIKTFIWRIIATSITIGTGWLISGNWKFGLAVGSIDTIIKTINSDAYDEESIALLRKLHPKPGLVISKKLNTHHIYPDVIIFKRNSQWIVESTKNTPLLISFFKDLILDMI